MAINDTVVYSWDACDGLESSSPYCLKVIYALRLKKATSKLEIIRDPRKMAPWIDRKKLPAAVVGGRNIQDSTQILKAIDKLFPDSPRLYPDNAAENSDVVLLEDWADESLIWSLLYYRWGVDANYKAFGDQIFATMPLPLRIIISYVAQKNVKKRLANHGILHWPEAERIERLQEHCGALGQRLLGGAYLVGQSVTAADLSVFSILEIMSKAKIPELNGLTNSIKPLNDWMARMTKLVHERK